MREKRSDADLKFGELLKKAIDESDEELDFFKQMSKVEIPPPETFMVGPAGSASRRRRYLLRTAIVLILVITGTFACTQLFDRTPTTATKVDPGSKVKSENGFVDNVGRTAETVNYKVYTYNSLDDLDLAKGRVADLKSAQYIPLKYIFKSLSLKVYENKAWTAEYDYENDMKQALTITINYYTKAVSGHSRDGVVSMGALNSGEDVFYVLDEKTNSRMVICYPSENEEISVNSSESVDFTELQKIIESIE